MPSSSGQTTSYLSTSATLPASVHAHAHATVTHLHGGSVWHFHMLLVVFEHLPRLDVDVPGTGGHSILRAVDGLAGVGSVRPRSLTAFGERIKLVL